MTEQTPDASKTAEGWAKPMPERVPAQTYQPAVLALGTTFILFGLVSSYAFCVAGGVLFAIALVNWIGELAHGD
ncbi:MAG TPA: hypothetical protein VMH37_05715 [Candidatus Binataceae bacterium]|nr:hypothetical protein [Candidatus Binataceae bacterium]